MKGKNKKTALLLTAVLAIWGILGFKVIGTLVPDNENQPKLVIEPSFVPTKVKKRDTFSIVANYRDPFLGTLPKSEPPKKTKVKTLKKPQPPKKNIFYSGSIAPNGTNNRMFFVTIDGQQHIMSKNQEINKVTLVWGNRESIKVKYPGHTATIPLKK